MSGPYLEQVGDVFRIGVKPKTGAGELTEAQWREKANTGRFVKIDAGQTNSQEDGLMEVELLADDDTVAYGRLEDVQGQGDMFTATIVVLGANGHALGNADPGVAVTDAQVGQTLKGAGDGKLKIASGGFGRVVGGNTKDLRIAWNGIEAIR